MSGARRRPRFALSVPRLMIAVAVIAAALGAGIEAWRSGPRARRYRELAEEHARIEAHYRREARLADSREWRLTLEALPELTVGSDDNRYHRDVLGMQIYWFGPGQPRCRADVERWGRCGRPLDRAEFYAGLRRFYERAASRPWESIGPEPRPPWERAMTMRDVPELVHGHIEAKSESL